MKNAALQWSLALVCALGACGWTEPRNSTEDAQEEREKALAQRLKVACASEATYDRLKQVAFDEAIRIRNADPVNLDLLSTHSLVRVENPVVKSRDGALDVTVCSGRFILQVPPGAERAFAGKRQLAADIEYAAQAAADGSGLVYQIKGAEPIIYSLAAFDLKAQDYRSAATAGQSTEVTVASSPTGPPSTRQASWAPAARSEPASTRLPPEAPSRSTPEPRAPEPARVASPSFNCRIGRSKSEQMVCTSERLASLDRQMSSQFYSELDRGDQRVRAALRRSRDRFLAHRERCGDESCVEQAYLDRMNEIQDIASHR